MAVRDNHVGSGLAPLTLSLLSYYSLHLAPFIFSVTFVLGTQFVGPKMVSIWASRGRKILVTFQDNFIGVGCLLNS